MPKKKEEVSTLVSHQENHVFTFHPFFATFQVFIAFFRARSKFQKVWTALENGKGKAKSRPTFFWTFFSFFFPVLFLCAYNVNEAGTFGKRR